MDRNNLHWLFHRVGHMLKNLPQFETFSIQLMIYDDVKGKFLLLQSDKSSKWSLPSTEISRVDHVRLHMSVYEVALCMLQHAIEERTLPTSLQFSDLAAREPQMPIALKVPKEFNLILTIAVAESSLEKGSTINWPNQYSDLVWITPAETEKLSLENGSLQHILKACARVRGYSRYFQQMRHAECAREILNSPSAEALKAHAELMRICLSSVMLSAAVKGIEQGCTPQKVLMAVVGRPPRVLKLLAVDSKVWHAVLVDNQRTIHNPKSVGGDTDRLKCIGVYGHGLINICRQMPLAGLTINGGLRMEWVQLSALTSTKGAEKNRPVD